MFLWTRLLQTVFRRARGAGALRVPPLHRCPVCGEEFRVAAGEPARCPRCHPPAA